MLGHTVPRDALRWRGSGGETLVMLAHIVGGGPVWALWGTGTVLFGGGVAAMAGSGRLRRACLAAAGLGLVATIAVYAAIPPAPLAPAGVTLRIANPPDGAAATSPLAVRVCATGTAVPGRGRLLSVSLDGHQVAEVDADLAVLTVAGGTHTLRVELLTSAHREYAPPLLTDETVTVRGPGVLTVPPACSS